MVHAKWFLSFLVLLFFAFACSKDDPCSNLQNGAIVGSLHGCSWLIKLDDGQYLEPVNLEDFDIEPSLDLEILVNYHTSSSFGSYCQFGNVVEIDCIRLKE